jgi:hypothetical protein
MFFDARIGGHVFVVPILALHAAVYKYAAKH